MIIYYFYSAFQLDDCVCRAERELILAERRLEELGGEERREREGGRRTQVRQGQETIEGIRGLGVIVYCRRGWRP